MDDMLALDGGRAANQWQKRHAKRKAADARKKLRAQLRQERKADFKKRMRKFRERWKAEAASRKAAGLPPPSKIGAPRDFKRSNLVDMTGWRFGRLTVLRVAPTSKQGGQRCRTWWVKCDCGSPERRVNGTCLRQGNVKSCGCLVRERLRDYFAKKREEQARLKSAPLSIRVAELRHRILKKKRITRTDAKLLAIIRQALVQDELRQGIRKQWAGRAVLVRRVGINSSHAGRMRVAA